VKVHLARKGERNATVIAEITAKHARLIPKGREIPLRKLQGGRSDGN
jgi:hypothetical protein